MIPNPARRLQPTSLHEQCSGPVAGSGGTVRWVLAKEYQAEIACVVRLLTDGVDVQVTYDGLLIGGRVCHDESEALLWAEERRREWLTRGWSEATPLRHSDCTPDAR